MAKKKTDKIDLLRKENDIHHALLLIVQRQGITINAFGVVLIMMMTSMFLINSLFATLILLILLVVVVHYVNKQQNDLEEHKKKLKEQLVELDKQW